MKVEVGQIWQYGEAEILFRIGAIYTAAGVGDHGDSEDWIELLDAGTMEVTNPRYPLKEMNPETAERGFGDEKWRWKFLKVAEDFLCPQCEKNAKMGGDYLCEECRYGSM